MRWSYVIAILISLPVAALSGLLAFVFNPITMLLLVIAAQPVRWFGRTPAIEGFSSMGPAMWMSIVWPLTLAPLHWLNYEIFGWKALGCACMIVATNVLAALAILLITSSPAAT